MYIRQINFNKGTIKTRLNVRNFPGGYNVALSLKCRRIVSRPLAVLPTLNLLRQFQCRESKRAFEAFLAHQVLGL